MASTSTDGYVAVAANESSTTKSLTRDEKRNVLMARLREKFAESGQSRLTETNQRNVMLIGRSRTGKSTIKSLLIDPTVVRENLKLKSETREPEFKSFFIVDRKIVLNIIDTPGLFERGDNKIDIRDNTTIMKTIQMCINREITKFHVICFCVAINVGINEQDMQSLQLLTEFLGPEVASNSCLIVTRCESKDIEELDELKEELEKDSFFQKIKSYFKLGIHFSGSLDPDDYKRANSDSLEQQFDTICAYRTKLIGLFTHDIVAYPINEKIIAELQRVRHNEEIVKLDLLETKNILSERSEQLEKLQKKSRCTPS